MPYLGNVPSSFNVGTDNINNQAVTAPKLSATGGTSGQVLALDAGGNLVWTSDPAGQWVTSGSNIYYDTGNVGIGNSAPNVPLEVSAATPIVRVSLSSDATKFGNLYHSAGTTAISSRNGSSNGIIIFQRSDGTTTTTSVTIDASGRLGIGTTSPNYRIEVVDSDGIFGLRTTNASSTSNSTILFRNKDGNSADYDVAKIVGSTLGNGGNGEIEFYTARVNALTQRAKIDRDGRLLVGTSSGSSRLTVNNGADSESDRTVGAIRATARRNGTPVVFRLEQQGTSGVQSTVDTGPSIGFFGYDGTDPQQLAEIAALADGQNVASGDSPGRLVFSTTADGASSPTERMRITSAGVLNSNNWSFNSLGTTTAANCYLGTFAPGSSAMAFATNGTERARIDSSGRLLVGTSSTRQQASNGGVSSIQIEGTSTAVAGIQLTSNVNNTSGSYLFMGKTRATSNGGVTAVQSGDLLASLQFTGADGTSLHGAANIECYVDGTPGSGDMPGRLVFSTTADGASSPTEAMRINNAGSILINTTTGGPGGASVTGRAAIAFNPSTHGGLVIASSSGAGSLQQFTNTAFGVVGSITTNGTSTAFNTSSDYRLKENIQYLDGAIDRLKQLPVHRFNFIANSDVTVDGFIAHEVQSVVPEAITGEKDAVDDEGNPVYQGIDQSKLVPLLTAALQEAIGEIESLKARVAALESA